MSHPKIFVQFSLNEGNFTRIIKKLLKNMGTNLSPQNIKKVNGLIDVKEELFHHARITHDVTIRTGAHKKRDDKIDFDTLVKNLKDLNGHQRVPGRKFGSIEYSEDLLDSNQFNKAGFFRWIANKNKEHLRAMRGSNAAKAIP